MADMSPKGTRAVTAASLASLGAAALMLVAVFSFGPVGRYAYAESICKNDPAKARNTLSSVPVGYKDTEKLLQYVDALIAVENKDYDKAQQILEELDYYRDCRVIIKDVYYNKALILRENGFFDEAMEYFEKSGSADGENQILATEYNAAVAEYEKGNFLSAAEAFEKLGDYSDCSYRRLQCKLMYAKFLFENDKTEEASLEAENILTEKGADDFYIEASDILMAYALELMDLGEWEKAQKQLNKCALYSDTELVDEKKTYCSNMIIYNEAVSLMNNEEYALAVDKFDLIKGFLDADELNAECEKEAYFWEFTGYLSKDGTADKKTTSFYRKDTIYFYGTLVGGKPGKSVTLLFTWTDCVGLTETVRVENWVDGSSGGVTFSYSNPTNANFGKSYITVTVEETGEQLAKYNFTIKK